MRNVRLVDRLKEIRLKRKNIDKYAPLLTEVNTRDIEYRNLNKLSGGVPAPLVFKRAVVLSELRSTFVERDFFGAALLLSKDKTKSVCEDSCFYVRNGSFTAMGVLDGLTGEKNSARASKDAALAFTQYFREIDSLKDVDMEEAFRRAKEAITEGATTASVFCVEGNDFIACAVGDSPIYLIDKDRNAKFLCGDGKGGVFSEVPLNLYRMLRSSVAYALVPDKPYKLEYVEGKLNGGMLLAVTDGFSDNFAVNIENKTVKELYGEKDLSDLIKENRQRSVPHSLLFAANSRVFMRELTGQSVIKLGDKWVFPKDDDKALAFYY